MLEYNSTFNLLNLYSTETYLFSGYYLFAEIGGVAGLLLGVSFFHFVKLLNFFFNYKIKSIENDQFSQLSTLAKIQELLSDKHNP